MTTARVAPSVGGVTRGSLPWWLLRQPAARTLVLISDEADVASLADDIQALGRLPEDWGVPKNPRAAAYVADDEPERLVALHQWQSGEVPFLIASVESLTWPVDVPSALKTRTFDIRPGSTIRRTAFEEALSEGGYSRTDRVEQVGEYAVRGDVIDAWPASEPMPLRITWNFDTVEAIREIDFHTQRSEKFRTTARLHPVAPGSESTLRAYIGRDTRVVVFATGAEGIVGDVDADVIPVGPLGDSNEGFEPPPAFAGNRDRLREQLVKWHEDDWSVVIFCHNRGERDRLEELLVDAMSSARGARPPWLPPFIIGELEHGFIQPAERRAVLANAEIFGRYRRRVRLPKFEGGGGISTALDLRPNDYLVHERHGIGRYLGLRNLKVGSVASEFLSIEYRGGDKVYVPVFEIQQVQKYLGAEGKRPALSSLDTAAWERIKSKVQEDVAKLAADLLTKAARRSIRPGHAFPSRSRLEDEFSESFMYKLTPDQQKTLNEVEQDMMSPRAMDRLICGDVGYGKTEIAMRAALKCALAGKQVALLCPTTILAEQHARNFAERLADYPVTVRLLSRFQDPEEQKQVIQAVGTGGVDIVIGTHRLLSADVVFPRLGLLIIDEEHRFGVRQKSKILGLRETVDVLSLTATPIPRTLASSMAGIKDLSVIETPPEGRLPISTHVGVFDEDVMVQAVQRELDRGGQVFYVHNRVKTLEARRQWLQKLLPTIRISMAHGQMNEKGLETAMHDFLHKKVDILLATTIIESGLDIPSVNTLIVEEAEEMGLAQLYQLRGRVGRSQTRAYCYLFYEPGTLSTDAKKRLDALKEYTALGSGLRLAMRDMEIRGAGNLLGPQQHGNIAAVGIETYGRLLNEEIQRLKGEDVEASFDGPNMEISLAAYIPDDYLPSESERVQMYKRILSADATGLAKIKDELIDRCGPLPPPAKTLCDAAALRLIAKAQGISQINEDPDGLVVHFRPAHTLPADAVQRLINGGPQGASLIPTNPPGIRVEFREGEAPLDALGRFLRWLFPS